MLCDVFKLRRSSYKYLVNSDNELSTTKINLRVDNKEFNSSIGCASGEIIITNMLTNEGHSLSRYRSENLMTGRELISC